MKKKMLRSVFAAAVLALAEAPAGATTKGLSQIVTPELQPEGTLSVSGQWQARQIANPYQLQLEAGLTSWLEAAVFQGLSPNEQVLGVLAGIVQKDPWYLTTGFINWSSEGGRPRAVLLQQRRPQDRRLRGVHLHADAVAAAQLKDRAAVNVP